MTNTLRLAGCKTDPLASYLKSIGVLRIIHMQLDSNVRGWFRAGAFHLSTRADKEGLIRFFTEQYSPSPVVSPWSGSRGFYKKGDTCITAIEKSSDPRLKAYRKTIAKARAILKEMGLTRVPTKGDKLSLLRSCRATLPDEAIPWLDVAYALSETSVNYFPLLVSGGNDGNMEFSLNFMEHVATLLLTEDGIKKSRSLLTSSLFAIGNTPLHRSAIGMFAPGGAGGANAATGFYGGSLVNPWDFVLMIEGSLAFAGAVARRLGDIQTSRAVFPFTVTPTTAGPAALSDSDSSGSQAAEIWFPVWGRPTSFPEISHVFSEGRAQSGRQQARRGVDFAMAASQLGVDRGIDSFQRYAFYVRNGLAHLAIPLENIEVTERPDVSLIIQARTFVDALRSVATDKGPARFRSLVRRIDQAILDFCKLGGARRLQRVLMALGSAERSLAAGVTDKVRERTWPLRSLDPKWLVAAYDDSAEYRLAAALASVGGKEAYPWPIRCQMEPVEIHDDRIAWSDPGTSTRESHASDVYRTSLAILTRRLVLASKHQVSLTPVEGVIPAELQDIHQFICGRIDEEKLTHLLWSMIAIKWPAFRRANHWPASSRQAPEYLSRLYALLKMVFLPEPIQLPGMSEPVSVRFEPEILTRLRGGDSAGAALAAIRRLRRSGLIPLITMREFADLTAPFPCSPAQCIRVGAALLFPIQPSDQRKLCNMVLARSAVKP